MKQRTPFFTFLLTFLLICALTSVWITQLYWTLPWTDFFQAASALPLEGLIFKTTILPRMAMAFVAGGALALASMLLQQVMHNPLASDSTLAVGSGAQTALLVCAIFLPAVSAWGAPWVAFVGAMAALFLVLWLSGKRQLAPLAVVLSGLVMTLYLGAIVGVLTLFYPEESRSLALWGAGSLVQDSWHDVGYLTLACALGSVGIAILIKPLNIMALSDEQAVSLGIPVKQVRLAALALAALLSAWVVASVGMLGFVGLAAAAAVRQMGVRTLWARLLAAFSLGGLMLLLTDNVLVLLNFYKQIDLPAGAVTALLGTPLLLWLMKRTAMGAHTSADKKRVLSRKSWLGALLPILVAAVCASLFLGQTEQGWYVSGSLDLLYLRAPRLMIAAACGVLLALAGVLLQRLTQNPMAGPELLGISSGAAVGVMTAVWFFNVLAGGLGFWLAGLMGALATLLAIVWFNQRGGMQPEKVLLTGMALAALASSCIQIWSASGDFRIQQMQVWLSGSTYSAQMHSAIILILLAIFALLALLPLQRWLGLLGLNAVIAQANGVNVAWARTVFIVLAALLTTAATLTMGPLSFIGLIAPHLAAMLGARLPRQQLLCAALLGATLMVCADFIGRQMMFPYEIPAGLVATLLGGTYFLYTMRKI
ncbi:Fe(3+)-hydroxamate ABC transporter permease FhuB [Neisseriaceae bacterium B1]